MISASSVVLVAGKCAKGLKAKLDPTSMLVANTMLIALPGVKYIELYNRASFACRSIRNVLQPTTGKGVGHHCYATEVLTEGLSASCFIARPHRRL